MWLERNLKTIVTGAPGRLGEGMQKCDVTKAVENGTYKQCMDK